MCFQTDRYRGDPHLMRLVQDAIETLSSGKWLRRRVKDILHNDVTYRCVMQQSPFPPGHPYIPGEKYA